MAEAKEKTIECYRTYIGRFGAFFYYEPKSGKFVKIRGPGLEDKGYALMGSGKSKTPELFMGRGKYKIEMNENDFNTLYNEGLKIVKSQSKTKTLVDRLFDEYD